MPPKLWNLRHLRCYYLRNYGTPRECLRTFGITPANIFTYKTLLVIVRRAEVLFELFQNQHLSSYPPQKKQLPPTTTRMIFGAGGRGDGTGW